MNSIKEKVSSLFLRLGNPDMAEVTEESLVYSYVVFGKKYIVEEKYDSFVLYKIVVSGNIEEENIIGAFSETQIIEQIARLYVQDIVREINEAEK